MTIHLHTKGEVMICPFCKEEIADKAIKCKHCGSMIEGQSNTTSSGAGSFEELINLCNCKESLKTKFKMFSQNKATQSFLGPRFTTPLIWTKYVNWFALLFNCWYYIFTGMWKKGLSLMGIAIAISFAGEAISPKLGQIGALVTALICLMSANYDRYRKLILKEDFWW